MKSPEISNSENPEIYLRDFKVSLRNPEIHIKIPKACVGTLKIQLDEGIHGGVQVSFSPPPKGDPKKGIQNK